METAEENGGFELGQHGSRSYQALRAATRSECTLPDRLPPFQRECSTSERVLNPTGGA
jgi:hypothetical protein